MVHKPTYDECLEIFRYLAQSKTIENAFFGDEVKHAKFCNAIKWGRMENDKLEISKNLRNQNSK